MRSLEIPQVGIDLVKHFEGFHKVVQRKPVVLAVPYVCPAGFFTIGFGHLCPQDHPPITEEQGEWFLASDMREALRSTLRLCPVLDAEPDARLGAIVSFTFNLGAVRLAASTLRKRVMVRDWAGAAEELKRWVWAGARKQPGLILRRAAEAELLR